MPGLQAEALGKQIGFFHRKSRVVFQSSFCLCGALGVVACQELSVQLYGLVQLWKANLLGHQGQAIKRCSLCGLCVPAGFSKATGECGGWGRLTGFREAAEKCL